MEKTENERSLERELQRSAAANDFWYQACKALVVRLVEDYLPVAQMQAVLAEVESDARGNYNALIHSRVERLGSDLVTELREIREAQDRAARGEDEE